MNIPRNGPGSLVQYSLKQCNIRSQTSIRNCLFFSFPKKDTCNDSSSLKAHIIMIDAVFIHYTHPKSMQGLICGLGMRLILRPHPSRLLLSPLILRPHPSRLAPDNSLLSHSQNLNLQVSFLGEENKQRTPFEMVTSQTYL